MSDYSNVGDTHIPHEADTAEAIDAQMRRTSDETVLADLASRTTHSAINDAAEVGGTYSQSEVNALQDEIVALNAALANAETSIDAIIVSHNKILGVLRDAELIPTA